MRTRAWAFVLAASALLTGCVAGPQDSRTSRRHRPDDDDQAFYRQDHPEATTLPPRDAAATTERATPREPERPNVKVELTVLDVISWDDVKIRGGIRGAVVRGVVSLTGWLAPGKDKAPAGATQLVQVQAGHEAQLSLADAGVRELVGPYTALRVAVLDTNERGEVDVVVDPLVSPDAEGQASLSTRVRVGPGEALVVGGHRSGEGDDAPEDQPGAAPAKRPHDRIAIVTVTVVRSKS